MQNVFVTAVEGKYAIDEFGRKLVITGNAPVYAGSRVYTDGNIIYGWVMNSQPVTYMPAPPNGVIPEYKYDEFYLTNSEQYKNLIALKLPYPADSDLLWFDQELPEDAHHQIPAWRGRPTFFNGKKKFFSFRGSYSPMYLYEQGREEPRRVSGKRLWLGFDDRGNIFYQEGFKCEPKSVIEARTYDTVEYDHYDYSTNTYYYVSQQKPFLPDDEPYMCYALDSRTHTDLIMTPGTVEQDDSSINVNTIVDGILSDIADFLTAQQAIVPQGEPTTPYISAPPPASLMCSMLCGNEGHEHEYSQPKHIPPCDTDTSYGGNPLNIPNFYAISDYYYDQVDKIINTYGYGSYNTMPRTTNDYRVIGRPRKLADGSYQFELIVHATYYWYPYQESLNMSNNYDPPIQVDSYRWSGELCRYRGGWLVNMSPQGIITKQEIWRSLVGGPELQPDRTSIGYDYTEYFPYGFSVEWKYVAESNQLWNGRLKLGNATYDKVFRTVDAVIPVGKSNVLVIGELDPDDPDSANNVFLYKKTHVVYSNLIPYDDDNNYVVTTKYATLKKFYKDLKDVPYVEPY